MDTTAVNRGIKGEYKLWDTAPKIDRIFIRGLSEHSYGNAVGLGLADVVSDRLLAAVDWNATWINSITACTPANSRTPVHFPTDRECLERIWATTGKLDQSAVTLGWIANSMELGTMRLSESLRPEIEGNSMLRIVGQAEELEFDRNGNLAGLLEAVTVER
jgi:hypothetical protein